MTICLAKTNIYHTFGGVFKKISTFEGLISKLINFQIIKLKKSCQKDFLLDWALLP